MFDALRQAGFDLDTRNHAEAILAGDFPETVAGLVATLLDFRLTAAEIIGSGGGQAASTMRLRDALYADGWPKHEFVTRTIVDGAERDAISHEVDHVKRAAHGTLALEIEWNNKDPFFDRDLENFQRLHAQSAISLGIIVTRGAALQAAMPDLVEGVLRAEGIGDAAELEAWGMKERTARQRRLIDEALGHGADFPRAFARSFVADKYGQATTHWEKLEARVARGVGNPCPLLLIGLPLSAVADGPPSDSLPDLFS
ncbi:MAG: BglII/BstYI family type II restriction endonuclease [Pseudomonadota bacterium]